MTLRLIARFQWWRHMKLTHIGISQFRSIGPEPVMIDLTKRITVLVGQNDCGKSNVLRGMEYLSANRQRFADPNHYPKISSLKNVPSAPKVIAPLNLVDFHRRKEGSNPRVWARFALNHDCVVNAATVREITLSSAVTDKASWVDSGVLNNVNRDELKRLAWEARPMPATVITVSNARMENNDPVLVNQVATQILYSGISRIPRLHIVSQFRRIDGEHEATAYQFDGRGVVKLLASWQVTDVGSEHLKDKFDRVVRFLRELIGGTDTTLEVPAQQDKIVVTDRGLRLPLESHGTGVHQLIILAIAVLSEDNVIFGIEEPEIHLHPVLQRRFLEFLLRETTNRYLITTHSAALIAPSDEVDVIHLKMIDGVTIPTRVDTDANALAVLDDLGVRASDLLQANSVIWVEGPSDRIFLNRWLELMEPTLREGVDYAVMFYGGRLLSHLSLERDEREETGFIKLLRINQRSAILMDSDRDNAADSINETKQRIQTECATNHLHAWLTDGREIENYLTKDCVDAALIEHDAKGASITIEPFERFETSMQKACGSSFKPSWAYEEHKPSWAHRFVKHMTRDQITGDLEARLQALISFIKPRS